MDRCLWRCVRFGRHAVIQPYSQPFGIAFFVFVLLISWSRIVLKRHTLKEVIYGACVGLLIGLLSYTDMPMMLPSSF